jgi:tRNA threonylcarbamoyladenosine biosynthesis protein TsaE
MSTFEQTASSEHDLDTIAKALLLFAGSTRVFCFEAEMGAGKTTFIKALCRALNCQSPLSSPTYSIVNEYKTDSATLYHFDLYRLQTIDELLEIGFEEYLYSNAYCFIEWPALAINLIQLPMVKVQILVKENIRYFRASIVE